MEMVQICNKIFFDALMQHILYDADMQQNFYVANTKHNIYLILYFLFRLVQQVTRGRGVERGNGKRIPDNKAQMGTLIPRRGLSTLIALSSAVKLKRLDYRIFNLLHGRPRCEVFTDTFCWNFEFFFLIRLFLLHN